MDLDADVRNLPETIGTKVDSPAASSFPLEEDGVEARGGVSGGHSHAPTQGQAGDAGLGEGVDPEHLRSASQGARPEDISSATDPTLGPDDRPGR